MSPPRRDVVERLLARVAIDEETGCWLWQGHLRQDGYGMIKIQGRMRLVHRVAYAHLVGPIPGDMPLDHVWRWGCRHKHCISPDHLEPVTSAENTRRVPDRSVFGRTCRAKTHCPQGHPYDGANTYVSTSSSGQDRRNCRACNRVRNLERYHALRRDQVQR